jgi:xylan 1,4-beta-xylosidase
MYRITPLLLPIILFFTLFGCQNSESDRDQLREWGTGLDNQRKADLGNGTYLNPIVPGDHPDPTIIKDGDDYYMTFSSFEAYPGLQIYHSRDLVNWQPVGPALETYIGSVWAPELTMHEGRFYLYIPARTDDYRSNYVIYADDIRGPWSEPIDLENPRIDPGHAVGEDGKRYLFLSAGYRAELSDDGLSIVEGSEEHVYEGWMYPDDWDVECYCQEGPKILKHGDYYYMITAVGGTAGPPTGHMVIAARSESIHGPWENSPYNPIVRTESMDEAWWSKGHATLVEGPDSEQWYIVYHAYENGYYNLGRQTLLEPITWTEDGWFRTAGHDVDYPIPMPEGGEPVPHGKPLSDNFSENRLGIQWSFFASGESEYERVTYSDNTITLEASGSSPANSSPLTFITGDQSYQFEIDVEFDEGAEAGVLLYYNQNLYTGLGVNGDQFLLHQFGRQGGSGAKPEGAGNSLRLRVTNNRHIVSYHYSFDEGKTWQKYDRQVEVSGYHHNVAHGFTSLKPAIYAAGEGNVRFRNFVYLASN